MILRATRRPASIGDEGAVVAEFAVALPAVAVVLLLAAGALGACAQQVRLQDAAADAARLAGRGESEARVLSTVAEVGGAAAIDHRGDLVCVTASSSGLVSLGSLGALSATSCALAGGG
ncbi:TadE family type IV pilus minor pilin [uncultured Microbacterium sp.]|uniref:TadE family type IV pilus minor pilin n=1 Tax=uncultured Microbacterium sp. TaxID=191216 RepID=UPI0035CAFEC1